MMSLSRYHFECLINDFLMQIFTLQLTVLNEELKILTDKATIEN